MPKRIVVCLDGTGNEPDTGRTNVRRLFDCLRVSDSQIGYYDPGVGTLGDENATNRWTKTTTRWGGLIFGHGVTRNVGQAYTFISRNWQPGDTIFVFGFSRGAFTARALTGLIRTVGLLRPELADNLLEYALDLYTKRGLEDDEGSRDKNHDWWDDRIRFERSFGVAGWERFEWRQIHFVGLWDTVRFVGSVNAKARWEEADWPFTSYVVNVGHVRHALAIDERRKKYKPLRLDPSLVSDSTRDVREVWFPGVHSDVGGTFKDHYLADISLDWMIGEATSPELATINRYRHGELVKTGVATEPEITRLDIDGDRFRDEVGFDLGAAYPPRYVEGDLHPAGREWWITGPGWHTREVRPGDEIHRSALEKRDRQAYYDPPQLRGRDKRQFVPPMEVDVASGLRLR